MYRKRLKELENFRPRLWIGVGENFDKSERLQNARDRDGNKRK